MVLETTFAEPCFFKMANLDILLVGEEPEEKKDVNRRFGLDELHISRYAYEKAFRYAKLIVDKNRESLEIGGFLTTPKDSQDRIARDAYLARDQEVTSVRYELSAEDVQKAGKELEQNGQRIVGWWHSHGKLNTFHSSTDDKNQMVLLNQISPSNYITVPDELNHDGLQSRVEGNDLLFWDPKNPSTKYKLGLKGEDLNLVAKRLNILKEKRIGFAYSFVVNYHRWLRNRVPYCEIATRDICSSCMDSKDSSVRVGYKIFDEGEFEIDDEKLSQEIYEKVSIWGRRKRANRSYFLPSTFESQRAAGTLKEPRFESHVYPDSIYSVEEGDNSKEVKNNGI